MVGKGAEDLGEEVREEGDLEEGVKEEGDLGEGGLRNASLKLKDS